MAKRLFIAEKPSVAREFAKILKVDAKRGNGYLESEDTIVTWCVGHLVTMSYPEVYDEALKKWDMNTLPFLPEKFLYEVIPSVKDQFNIVAGLLNREDVDTIYVCTDSGREGEYIYRLGDQMAKVPDTKKKLRVWIDSQTEEEILRGVREAKPIAEYDNLSHSAYLRAKEDYLMGINFSRVLSLKYGYWLNNNFQDKKWTSVSVGRVMTCVLGMVVKREWEIRNFKKTPFYRVIGDFSLEGKGFQGEWKAVEGSAYYESPALYKENGFKERKKAEELIQYLQTPDDESVNVAGIQGQAGLNCRIESIEKKKEKKNPPLLYNLAELQNDCSKMFKISPDEALKVVQELYEKKLVTYPRTDARVLSSAVAKEIHKNIGGLRNFAPLADLASEALELGSFKTIGNTRYVNDKQITDHYAIIPTGQGFGALRTLGSLQLKVYEVISRRFLSIFYPPAVYQKFSLDLEKQGEHFFANYRVLAEEGYLKAAYVPKKTAEKKTGDQETESGEEKKQAGKGNETEIELDGGEKARALLAMLSGLKKGQRLSLTGLEIREGETSPPRRYTSGSMILAMENAGQLIEDEELRSQIKGSGIGTSATRAEILKKLCTIKYLSLAKKTQVITPTLLGEMVFDVCSASIRQLLNPELTASWEKGLTYVAEGTITPAEYMEKLERFVTLRTNGVRQTDNQYLLRPYFDAAAQFYKK